MTSKRKNITQGVIVNEDADDAPATQEVIIPHEPSVFGRPTLAENLESAELVLAVTISSFLGFLFVAIYGAVVLLNSWLYNDPKLAVWQKVFLTAAYPIVLFGQFRTTRLLGDTLHFPIEPRPVAAAMALRHRHPGLLRRATMATWLFANAMAVLWTGWLIVTSMRFYNPSVGERVFAIAIQFIVQFAAVNAANACIVHATVLTTGSEMIARALWRMRFLLDFSVSLVIVLLPVTR